MLVKLSLDSSQRPKAMKLPEALASGRLVAGSQSRVVPSQLLDASRSPDGLKETWFDGQGSRARRRARSTRTRCARTVQAGHGGSFQQDVRWFQVAVQQTVPVCGMYRVSNLGQ
jgi:hypothetical protein